MLTRLFSIAAAFLLLCVASEAGGLPFGGFYSTVWGDGELPESPSIVYADQATLIRADNAYHVVARLEATDLDPVFVFTLTTLEITAPGAVVVGSADCGAFDYSLSGAGEGTDLLASLGVFIDNETLDVGELFLRVLPAGTEDGEPGVDTQCALHGAVVTATFAVYVEE